MPPESEGGVFIPTEKIYELLVDSINQTNERLSEIRSDIRAMHEENLKARVVDEDHEKRIRNVEEALAKLPWTNITAITGAASGIILAYMKITGK